MTTYALVHGAWHGGWCFDLLAAELRRRGHQAVAMDLPCEDPDAGCARYADVVTAALADAGDDVVLVGHSLGGLTIPLVAAARPVRRMVFLCALLPVPGQSLDEQQRADRELYGRGLGRAQVRHPDDSTSWTADAAIEWMYDDCPRERAVAAAARLRRQYWTPSHEVTPLAAWPDTPRQYILCTGDRVCSPDWARRVAPGRLGVEPVELPGGHSPYLSRPAELADLLTKVEPAWK